MYTVPDIGRWIDAVAVHAYSRDYKGIFYRLDLARNQTIRSLGVSKKMFVTEFGWATGGTDPDISTTTSGQATRLRDAYTKLLEKRSYYKLVGAYWFGLKDRPSGRYWHSYTGLFDSSWRMKPAWKALVKITGGRE
jgi:hypothetical protein